MQRDDDLRTTLKTLFAGAYNARFASKLSMALSYFWGLRYITSEWVCLPFFVSKLTENRLRLGGFGQIPYE